MRSPSLEMNWRNSRRDPTGRSYERAIRGNGHAVDEGSGAVDAASTPTRTSATPSRRIPSAFAAAAETSMIRARPTGPRSVMRTTTDRPDERSVTRTRVPNGSDGWAAVNAAGSSGLPSAIRVWPGSLVYHDARPCSAQGTGAAACCRGAAQPATRSTRRHGSEAVRIAPR